MKYFYIEVTNKYYKVQIFQPKVTTLCAGKPMKKLKEMSNNKSYLNPFHELVMTTMPRGTFDKVGEDLGSTHMRTKILKEPKRATHKDLLIFAKALGMSASELFNCYELGKEGLHELEKELYPAAEVAA